MSQNQVFKVKGEAEWSWDKGMWGEIEPWIGLAEDATEAIEKARVYSLHLKEENSDKSTKKKTVFHTVLDYRAMEVEIIIGLTEQTN